MLDSFLKRYHRERIFGRGAESNVKVIDGVVD